VPSSLPVAYISPSGEYDAEWTGPWCALPHSRSSPVSASCTRTQPSMDVSPVTNVFLWIGCSDALEGAYLSVYWRYGLCLQGENRPGGGRQDVSLGRTSLGRRGFGWCLRVEGDKEYLIARSDGEVLAVVRLLHARDWLVKLELVNHLERPQVPPPETTPIQRDATQLAPTYALALPPWSSPTLHLVRT